jgi:hypothetical protein
MAGVTKEIHAVTHGHTSSLRRGPTIYGLVPDLAGDTGSRE